MRTKPKILRNLSLAALASTMLGGCYYGDVYGASSYATYDCAARYGDEYWSNDPYAYDDASYGYDCYDAADYHSGFVQIGFGGGWHQNLYYPGYGLFLFDRYGRRHGMSHDYLTYWGGRRAWYKHHGRHGRGGDRYRGDGNGSDGHRPGRGYRHGDASDMPHDRPRGDRYDGRPRRGGSSWTPPAADGSSPVTATRPLPRTNAQPRGSGNVGNAPPPRSATSPRAAPAPRAAPQPSSPPPARSAPPPRDGGGGRVRED